MSILKLLNEKSLESLPIVKVHGQEFRIKPLSPIEIGKLSGDAERIARKNLEGNEHLKNEKVDPEKIKSLIDLIKEEGSENQDEAIAQVKKFKNEYDYQLHHSKLLYLSELISLECIVTMDGSKIYSSDEEKRQGLNLLAINQEFAQDVQNAYAGLQKKTKKGTSKPKRSRPLPSTK